MLLAGCGGEDPYALKKPSLDTEGLWAAGEERWVISACGQCPVGCGIRVRVVDGRAIKIDGNPECPLNRGGLGPKGQSGLQMLYHPDRIPSPLRRDGPRGSGRWKPLSWEEAIAELAGKLRELREAGEPRGLLVLNGDPRGITSDLFERFLRVYGSPNHIDHRSAAEGSRALAMEYMQGLPDLPAHDWERTRYVLGFGDSFFESWCQTIHFMRASSYMRRGMPGSRVKFVQVSPRFSVTAAKADEWVPIKPGTHGALALGLARVLIDEDLCDGDFLREHTVGFDPWKDADGRSHRGFRDLVLEDYPLEKVQGITGVRTGMIRRLAREMTLHQPAIAVADDRATAATNGLGSAMAIHALNALLGNLGRPGGVLAQRAAPLTPWMEARQDGIARVNRSAPRIDGAQGTTCLLGHGAVQRIPEAVLSGRPYPVKALIFHRSNPIFSKPEGRRWIEALDTIPLVVSCSPLADESTMAADLILPDHTYLERWEIVEPVPTVGYPILGLRTPAVKPLHDSRATGDVVIALARAIGPPVSDAFPWKGYREAALERLRGVHEAQEGAIVEETMPRFARKMEIAGGWWAPGQHYGDWQAEFRTPSGRFEFFSRALESRLREAFPEEGRLERHLEALGVASKGDDLCLPHWEPAKVAGDPHEFPFLLIPYRGIEYAEGGARHLPWLRELPRSGRMAWSERIDLHPADAAQLGTGHNETVWVTSPVGRRRVLVQVDAGMQPGSVGLPLGHGDWPPDPAQKEQTGGYALLVNHSDPLTGVLALHGTRVRIEKADA